MAAERQISEKHHESEHHTRRLTYIHEFYTKIKTEQTS